MATMLEGEYAPSAAQWVRDQVEAFARSNGQEANTLRDTGLPLEQQIELNHLTLQRQTEFEDLPEQYQRLILQAEATRQRHLEAVEAGTPHALDYLWDEAAAKAAQELDAMPKAPSRRASPRSVRAEKTAVPS